MFLPLDVVYTLVFIPGIIAALFGYYHIVGIMTLLVLPLALLWNGFIFRTQRLMFKSQDLRVRRNGLGFFTYVIGYSMVLQPNCVWGYLSELAGLRKNWGTKWAGSRRSSRRACCSPSRMPPQRRRRPPPPQERESVGWGKG